MATWQRSKVLWGILLTTGIGLALSCRGRDNPRLPPADDAFLSYLQAAQGLARVLRDSPPEIAGENRLEKFAAALTELEKYQAAAEALAPEEIQRLAREEHQIVHQAKQAWDELDRLHEMNPNLFSADWLRLETAYRLCRELPQP